MFYFRVKQCSDVLFKFRALLGCSIWDWCCGLMFCFKWEQSSALMLCCRLKLMFVSDWSSALMYITDGDSDEHLHMLEGGIIKQLLADKWKTFARVNVFKVHNYFLLFNWQMGQSIHQHPLLIPNHLLINQPIEKHLQP